MADTAKRAGKKILAQLLSKTGNMKNFTESICRNVRYQDAYHKALVYCFGIYQLKNIPENREIQFRSYETLQKNQNRVHYGNYEQKYPGRLLPVDTPEIIRERFNKQTLCNFDGHSISISDVLVLNKAGEVIAYYVEKEGFTVIAGFIRNGSSGALISYDTTDFISRGKRGAGLPTIVVS